MKQLYAFLLLLLALVDCSVTLAQDVTLAGPAGCNAAAVTGTWTVPCGVTSVTIQVWGGGGGAGGGGGGSNGGLYDTRGGGGAGGGGYTTITVNVTPGATYNYSVGAGGCGGSNGSDAQSGGNGTAGGNSSFTGPGVSLTANGGARGGGGSGTEGSPGSGGAGGNASGGSTNTPGTAGVSGNGGNGGVGGAGGGPGGGAGGASTGAAGAAYGGGGAGGGNSQGGRGGAGGILITYNTPITLPPTPTITSTTPTCSAAGSSTISNYNPSATYTFTPSGPTVGAGGAITSMTVGTSYTVIATESGCNSAPSASFSNAAQTAPPATPTISSTPAACGTDGSSTISNYSPSLTYTFTPSGPTAGAGGAISGMTIGTNYTVIASDGTCNSPTSASFSNAAAIVPPATPTVASTPPSCSAAGSSSISNYNAAFTYTFSPAGPVAGAGGAITGMTTGTSYTVTANDGTCNSSPSASFSNAAQVAPPAVPVISTTAPSCTADGASTITNFNASLTYTFTPTGPSAGAGGSITGMTAGTSYTVIAGDGTCNSSASATFSNAAQFPPAVATINGSLSYCTGFNTTLTASGGVSYAWTDASSANIGNTASVTVTQGTYTVVVTDANGCTASTNATVTESTSLSVTIIGNLNYCPGGNTTLTANGGTNFNWSNGSATAAITVGAGTYSVTASDASGCTGSTSVTVAEFAAPVAAISGALNYCVGGNTTITASGGVSYVWNDAANSTTPGITVTQGSYTVTATDGNGCTASASATVTENAPPTITVSGALSYCAGSSTTLTASGATTYAWSNGSNTATVNVTQGNYTITATDAAGCTNTTDVVVTENPNPTAAFNFVSNCAGEAVVFTNASTGADSYLWNFGNGTTSTDTDPTVTFTAGGSFTVSLTASTALNCSNTVTQTVVVADKPVADFSAQQLTLMKDLEALSITNNSTGATAWFWLLGDSTVSSDFEPQHIYSRKGVYSVTLIASNAGGCSDTLTKTNWVTVVDNPALFIPNLFSPNDDGSNDFFKIEGSGFKKVEMKIFNRWGEKVFESEDATQGWDGYAAGVKAQPGAYVYYLTVTYETLTTNKYTGTLMLVR